MPYEITFDRLPAGYAASCARPGEDVVVCLSKFVSSEDGDELIKELEGLPQVILSKLRLPSPVLPSTVDTLLAIIRKDKSATVYLNEVDRVGEIRIRGPCRKGELISRDRVLDMGKVKFVGVDIPLDAGIVYVFSVGWRKGLFYDLSPLQAEATPARQYDLEEVIGSLHAYLTFQERLKVDEATWRTFLAQKWFPFAHLDNALLREMILHAQQGWQIDDLLPKIAANVQRLLVEDPLSAKDEPVFADHAEILKASVKQYDGGDHIGCASVLYPRIEGLLRSFMRIAGYTTEPNPKTLRKVAIEHHHGARITNSLLLPAKFNEYLDTVYFAHFTSGSAPDVGRHSVAHGEARTDAFSLKATTIGFLIVYQLSLFFSSGNKTSTGEQAADGG